MLADYHIHTEYSDDSVEKMERVIKTAIDRNIDEICFTDHVDYGVKSDPGDPRVSGSIQALNVDYLAYFRQIEQLQEKYDTEIIIKKGLEFGMQKHTISQFQKLFDTYEMDFIILSCHQAENKEFWNYEFQKDRSQDEYIARYYQEIYDCIRLYKDYSILGHLDMIQRYTEPRHPFEKSRDIIAAILEQAIADDKGIEVNTSSFQYKLPDLMPERNILKLYYDLGGKIITVGSDAHTAGRLGAHIPYIYEQLRNIGFRHICTCKNMVVEFHSL